MQEPQLVADLTFLPTARGGRHGPTSTGAYGCVYQLAAENWDCRILVGSEPISPGETRRAGLIFLSGDAAAKRVRAAGKFALWEGRVIGSGVVVT